MCQLDIFLVVHTSRAFFPINLLDQKVKVVRERKTLYLKIVSPSKQGLLETTQMLPIHLLIKCFIFYDRC